MLEAIARGMPIRRHHRETYRVGGWLGKKLDLRHYRNQRLPPRR